MSKTNCKGIVSTKKYLTSPWKLAEWKKEYMFIIQEVHQIVTTVSGSAHQISYFFNVLVVNTKLMGFASVSKPKPELDVILSFNHIFNQTIP